MARRLPQDLRYAAGELVRIHEGATARVIRHCSQHLAVVPGLYVRRVVVIEDDHSVSRFDMEPKTVKAAGIDAVDIDVRSQRPIERNLQAVEHHGVSARGIPSLPHVERHPDADPYERRAPLRDGGQPVGDARERLERCRKNGVSAMASLPATCPAD